jgi:hypothetical protein
MILKSPGVTSPAVGGGTASRDGEGDRADRRLSPPAAPRGALPPDAAPRGPLLLDAAPRGPLPPDAAPRGPLPPDAADRVGRLAARRTLRGQIARLERELVEQRCSSWPRTDRERRAQPAGLPGVAGFAEVPGIDGHARVAGKPGIAGSGRGARVAGLAGHGRGARVLAIDRLEALRDELVETLSAERRALASRTLAEEESRRLREELMLDPAANAGARVRNADAGEGGCGEVRSEPVGGVLGMLMGWWRVVVSSGCP